jgi:hypothetical protein
MKESDYPHYHQLIRGDVYTAVECFHTYLEIHNFAGKNTNVYRAMNKCAAFWNIQLYSLQSNFFIVLARIFDKRRDVHSVHKLLTATVDHPEFFFQDGAWRAEAK